MFILAIETTGPLGSVALLDEKENVLGYEVSQGTMSHLKDLIPMINTMLNKCGVSINDVDLLAPSVGPGSFTGIRIGVSTARALCQALGIRAVPVPTLEAFCFKETARTAEYVQQIKGGRAADGQTSVVCRPGTAVCAIINARRGQVYGMIDSFMEPGPYMLTDVIEVYKSKLEPYGCRMLFFGDGIDAYEKDIIAALGQPIGKDVQRGRGAFGTTAAGFEFVPKGDRYQDAVSVGKWAVDRIKRAGGVDGCTVDYENLMPDYMRRAEAEQKLESGELPICKGPKQE